MSLLGVAVLAVAVGSGCTQVSAGEPRPAGPPASDTESGASTTERPRQIRLDGKDPCVLVPEADWPTFGIEKPGKSTTSEELSNSPECFYGTNGVAYFVTLVVAEGIGVWLDGSRAAEVGETEPVAGYPAITLTIDMFPNRCDVVVDVSDGQYLRAGTLPSDTEVPVSESCAVARELAESAMNTLMGA